MGPRPVAPCGMCRQVLVEFNPRAAVLIAGADEGDDVETSLDVLLPQPFGPGL